MQAHTRVEGRGPCQCLPQLLFHLVFLGTYVYESLAYMYMCGLLLCSAHGAEKRESDNLGLGLQMSESHTEVPFWEAKRGPLQEQVFLTSKPSQAPHLTV